MDNCSEGSEFRYAVKRIRPKTLQNAITAAMQEESIRLGENSRKHDARTNRRTVYADSEAFRNANANKSTQQMKPIFEGNRRQPKRCFQCNSTDHLLYQRPINKRSGGKQNSFNIRTIVAVKQFRTEAVGRAPVEKSERPNTQVKRDLPLHMAAVVNKRAQEKHSSVIQTDNSGEMQLNETDQVLRTSVSMNRRCTEKISLCTESLEVRIPGKNGFQKEGLIQGTKVIWKVDTGARKYFITEETYYNIIPENRPVLDRVRTTFLSANGQEINTIGTAKMINHWEMWI